MQKSRPRKPVSGRIDMSIIRPCLPQRTQGAQRLDRVDDPPTLATCYPLLTTYSPQRTRKARRPRAEGGMLKAERLRRPTTGTQNSHWASLYKMPAHGMPLGKWRSVVSSASLLSVTKWSEKRVARIDGSSTIPYPIASFSAFFAVKYRMIQSETGPTFERAATESSE